MKLWRPILRFCNLALSLAVASLCVEAAAEPLGPGDAYPKPIKKVDPLYPMGMSRAGVEARVVLRFVVNKEGLVVNPVVHTSNNPWFDRPALDAIMHWRFEPGRKNGVPVAVHMQLPISFSLDGRASPPGLWKISKGKDHKKMANEFRWDIAPVPVNTTFPVYPFEALQADAKGKTRIRFVIGANGRIFYSEVLEATSPEFGAAALAMIERWEFDPARYKDDSPCLAVVEIEHDFNPNGTGNVPVSRRAREILRLIDGDPGGIFGLNQLDEPSAPVSRVSPVFPTALLKSETRGETLIEFFIDELGDVQLPYVISASAPEFGHAAVQAVAAWRFTQPKVKGKPVIARARIPINFKLPNREDSNTPDDSGR